MTNKSILTGNETSNSNGRDKMNNHISIQRRRVKLKWGNKLYGYRKDESIRVK